MCINIGWRSTYKRVPDPLCSTLVRKLYQWRWSGEGRRNGWRCLVDGTPTCWRDIRRCATAAVKVFRLPCAPGHGSIYVALISEYLLFSLLPSLPFPSLPSCRTCVTYIFVSVLLCLFIYFVCVYWCLFIWCVYWYLFI